MFFPAYTGRLDASAMQDTTARQGVRPLSSVVGLPERLPGRQPYHCHRRHGDLMERDGLTPVDVAGAGDVPEGSMVHVEAAGLELLLANVAGRFYAVGDRCGHEGARLSAGRLDGTVVTCPAHASRFDIVTGKNLSGPVMAGLPGLAALSPRVRAMVRRQAEIMARTPVRDLPAYRVTVVDGRVLVEV